MRRLSREAELSALDEQVRRQKQDLGHVGC